LRYDALKQAEKVAAKITKTNSRRWKTVDVVLKDANFGNKASFASDLVLLNTDAEDDIFHIVEVTRTTGDRKGYWGLSSSN
jgi:hypothetical protein